MDNARTQAERVAQGKDPNRLGSSTRTPAPARRHKETSGLFVANLKMVGAAALVFNAAYHTWGYQIGTSSVIEFLVGIGAFAAVMGLVLISKQG